MFVNLDFFGCLFHFSFIRPLPFVLSRAHTFQPTLKSHLFQAFVVFQAPLFGISRFDGFDLLNDD